MAMGVEPEPMSEMGSTEKSGVQSGGRLYPNSGRGLTMRQVVRFAVTAAGRIAPGSALRDNSHPELK
jgi:hypothetical protein